MHESDHTFVKEPEAVNEIGHLLSEPNKLEVPRDPDVCDRIAKHWELYGFGHHQAHWDNQGRPPANAEEVFNNRLSRNIRQRFWKIWKRSTLDELTYKVVTDAAKDLALANNQRRMANLLVEAMENNLEAMATAPNSAEASGPTAPPEVENESSPPLVSEASIATASSQIGKDSSLEPIIIRSRQKEELCISYSPRREVAAIVDVEESGAAAPPTSDDVEAMGAAAPPEVWRMESFTPEEMATVATAPHSTQNVRIYDPLPAIVEVRKRIIETKWKVYLECLTDLPLP